MNYFFKINVFIAPIIFAVFGCMAIFAGRFRFNGLFSAQTGDMLGTRAMTVFTADIFQMAVLGTGNIAALVFIADNMADNTLRVVLAANLFKYCKSRGVRLGAPFFILIAVADFAGF